MTRVLTVAAGLHGQVLDAIGADLASGVLAPGQVRSSERLEERHGVSRTVVREAVRVLEQLGIVHSRRRVASRSALSRIVRA